MNTVQLFQLSFDFWGLRLKFFWVFKFFFGFLLYGKRLFTLTLHSYISLSAYSVRRFSP